MKAVTLNIDAVLKLIANPSFYAAVPGFDALRVQAETLRARVGVASGHGCRSCRQKKMLLQEYVRLYTEFIKAYTGLWSRDRAALLRLCEFVGADAINIPVRGGTVAYEVRHE